MKIIKRNGAEATFDITKITAAITKANNSDERHRELTAQQIEDISASVEKSCNEMGRAAAVEEIQDMVENRIMQKGAFEVAKRYIRYRYTRSLARRANTTDNQILSLIECNNEEAKQENANKNPTVNSVIWRARCRRILPAEFCCPRTLSRRTRMVLSTFTTWTTTHSICTTATS